tara:strand:+ start:394 stop:549 length:156 start_codon:yes stop_codon:yes gene_type:complete
VSRFVLELTPLNKSISNQSAINSFLQEYALSSVTWQKDWYEEIKFALRELE